MPASAKEPDLRVLAGYVRNRLKDNQTAEFWVHGHRIFLIPMPQQSALLVASERGESILLTGKEPIHTATFISGRFSLQRAAFLTRLIDAIRGTTGTLGKRT